MYIQHVQVHVHVHMVHTCTVRTCTAGCITRYGSTLNIGIAMVFVFSPYIRKLTPCFDFTAQNMSKVICVLNIPLDFHMRQDHTYS